MRVSLRGHGIRRRTRRALAAVLDRELGSWEDTRNRRDDAHLRVLAAATLGANDNGIDIGANEGNFVAELLRVAPGGRHIAFEPLPEFAARLQTRFPAVDVHQAAASDTAGPARFFRAVGAEGMSGLRQRTYTRPVQIEPLNVQTERLDDVLPPGYVPTLLKIDVEGGELQVLLGAFKTLQRCHPVIAFEHGLGAADHYGTRPEQIYDLLVAELGYRVFDIDGFGPYDRAGFVDAFASPRIWNFIARV